MENVKISTQTNDPVSLGSDNSTVILSKIIFSGGLTKELLSVTEFASEADVSAQAVRKMIAEDRLHAEKVGEQYVITRNELNRYLADR